MAEGDSIHRLARKLNTQVSGRSITKAEAHTRKVNVKELVGGTFIDVRPHGKHLLMHLAQDSSTRTLHSHLQMQGSWTLLGAGKHMPQRLKDEIRLIMHLDNDTTLVALNMPVLELVEKDENVIGYLGPDILADDFSVDDAIARMNTDTPIVQSILDQRNVAGIGNLWAVESLFIRGIYPWTNTKDVDVNGLLKLNRRMMLYSRDVQPGMITTGNKRKGETHWVYGRYNHPCRRCGTPISFRKGGSNDYDRETWWCPNCQPAQNA